MRYFEDFEVGDIFEIGSKKVTRVEMIAFAEAFDPQPFHTSEEKAQDSIFGKLVASGWHTCAIFMRLYVDHFLTETISLGSPGVDHVRWLKPVFPNDILSGRITILETKPSSNRAGVGSIKIKGEMLNQSGEVVMQLEGTGLFAKKHP
ncbi:MAG: MaoC family dehydratase [Desulfobacterales bacterium]|jgi:acyl dehydratase